jgi:hypothetical protein
MPSRRSYIFAAAIIAALSCWASPLRAATLYSDDFTGGTSDLNGTAPDTRPGSETWIAASNFDANGDVNVTDPTWASATLAFTPSDGKVYTLDGSLRDLAGNSDWIAMGFANGQSSSSGSTERFINGGVIGQDWMLVRGPGQGGNNQAFTGTATSGTDDGQAWAVTTYQGASDVDLRLELDTTGGSGNWTATWLAKAPGEASYTVVRSEEAAAESINSVGFATAGGDVTGNITRFSLSDDTTIPEPASLAVLGFGGLVLLRRRRRR